MSSATPESVEWLGPSLRTRPRAWVAAIAVTVAWNSSFFYLATLSCPAARDSQICGWGWAPIQAILVAVVIGACELLGLVIAMRYMYVYQVGLSPTGLGMRVGRRTRIVPWARVRFPRTSGSRPSRPRQVLTIHGKRGNLVRGITLPADIMTRVKQYRERVETHPASPGM